MTSPDASRIRSAFLSSIRVLELGSALPAAAAGRILRQLGAQVEIPSDRELDPVLTHYLDRAKRDAGRSTDMFTADELASYDVVLHGFNAAPRHDPIRERLRAARGRNPGLIVTAVTPYGTSGRDAALPGNDATVAARAGLSHLTPRDIPKAGDGATQPPLPMPGNLVSTYAAAATAVAVLGALRARTRGAGGQEVDVSMLEAILPTLRREIGYFVFDGEVSSRFMRVWRLAPWGVKACADGYFFVQVVEEHHWLALVELMGDPEWALDPELRNPIRRYERRAEVDAGVEAWIAHQRSDDLTAAALERRLPFAPVNRPGDVTRLAQINYRRFLTHIDDDAELELPVLTRAG